MQDIRKLGSMEQALTLTDLFSPMTVVGVLRLTNGPATEQLRQILDRVQQNHTLLQMRIVQRGNQFYFERMPQLRPIPLQRVERTSEDQWEDVAQAELNSRINIESGPLMRCTHLVGSDDSELIFAYHHTILDATSGLHFYDRFLTECGAGATGSPNEKQAPVLPPVETLLPKNFRGIRLLGPMAAFMARQMLDEFRYYRTNKARPPSAEPSFCRIFTVELPDVETEMLVRAARRNRVTVHSALQAAFLQIVNRYLHAEGTGWVRYMTFANLRRYLKPPVPDDHPGCYISMMRFTTDVRENTPFWQQAQAIQDQMYVSMKRGEKYLAAVVSKTLMKIMLRRKSDRLASTALSYAGPAPLKSAYGPIQVRGVHGFITNNVLGVEYAAFGKLFDGRLNLDMLYMDVDMNMDTARLIAEDILTLLRNESNH